MWLYSSTYKRLKTSSGFQHSLLDILIALKPEVHGTSCVNKETMKHCRWMCSSYKVMTYHVLQKYSKKVLSEMTGGSSALSCEWVGAEETNQKPSPRISHIEGENRQRMLCIIDRRWVWLDCHLSLHSQVVTCIMKSAIRLEGKRLEKCTRVRLLLYLSMYALALEEQTVRGSLRGDAGIWLFPCIFHAASSAWTFLRPFCH